MATLTVYSDAADGYLRSNSGTWSIARAGTGGALVDGTEIQIGGSSTAYYTREAFVSFDTSSIPDAAVISAVVLSLYGFEDSSTFDTEVRARNYSWGTTLEFADWVPGANLTTYTLLATYPTSAWSITGYNDFSENGSNFRSAVNKTGTTSIVLYCSTLESASAPSIPEHVKAYASEAAGTTQDPKLVITYDATEYKTPADNAGIKVTEGTALQRQSSPAANAAVNVAEAAVTEQQPLAADAENAAVNVTESAATQQQQDTAATEGADLNASETGALAVATNAAEAGALNVAESPALLATSEAAESASVSAAEAAAIQAIGDFPPLRLRIDVYDAAGNRLGAGPITSVLAASYRMELDRIGSFGLEVPATDERAALLAQGNEVRMYREGEGLVFRGLVDRATWVLSADGSLVFQASGSSIARRLAWENTLLGRTFDGSTLASAVGTLLTGSGWNSGSLDAPPTTLLARFDGLPVWAALGKVAEVFRLHVREDLWNEEVDVGALGAIGGVVLQNVEAISPALRENRRLAPVAGLRVLEESADVWNRIVPLGAGEGVNKLDLRYATRSSPYAVQSAIGPDGRTYYFLEDAASVAAYGRRTRVLSVKDALPLANSPAGFTAAANALYDVATTWLARHKDPRTAYEVEVVGLRHLDEDGTPLFQVGDRLRLVYRGIAQRSDGTRQAWLSVDASLWLMGFERSFRDDGSDSLSLKVATVDRHEEDETSRLAEVFEGMHALNVSLRPYTYREIHGPERRSIDATHNVTFVVDYDANVSYLHQALLSVAVKPVRTNATGASSGGGNVATSGGGSSHSHTISGQSASAGGGQTSSAEAAHTHSVSGQSASAAGAHRHLMFAAVGSGPAATSSVPDVASTQLESSTHYHNGTGSGFPNVGSHSHSLNNHRHVVNNYQVAGYNSTGSAFVYFWMILPDGQSFNNVYTYEAAANHTHTVTGTTSSSGSSHSHTVADHTHAVTGTTSSAETSHTHSVTIPTHTHALIFGIYEGGGPTAGANVTVAINGTDRTAALGGPFDGDFLAKDITQYLQDAQGQPLRQRNTIVFTAGELLDLEIVCKSLVTATSLVPV